MLLHKQQVYRHILFNRESLRSSECNDGRADEEKSNERTLKAKRPGKLVASHLAPSRRPSSLVPHLAGQIKASLCSLFCFKRPVSRLYILLNLIEVYMKWYKQEKEYSLYLGADLFLPHFFYLLTCSLTENLVFQISLYLLIVMLSKSFQDPPPIDEPISRMDRSDNKSNQLDKALADHTATLQPKGSRHPRLGQVAMAVIVSSFCKLIISLMVIWDFNELSYSWLINVFVLTSNTEAIIALFDVKSHPRVFYGNYKLILLLVLLANAIRWAFQLSLQTFIDPIYPTYIL